MEYYYSIRWSVSQTDTICNGDYCLCSTVIDILNELKIIDEYE